MSKRKERTDLGGAVSEVALEDMLEGDEDAAVEVEGSFEQALGRELGTADLEPAGRRSEVRKDGSIAFFSSESAAASFPREVGS